MVCDVGYFPQLSVTASSAVWHLSNVLLFQSFCSFYLVVKKNNTKISDHYPGCKRFDTHCKLVCHVKKLCKSIFAVILLNQIHRTCKKSRSSNSSFTSIKGEKNITNYFQDKDKIILVQPLANFTLTLLKPGSLIKTYMKYIWWIRVLISYKNSKKIKERVLKITLRDLFWVHRSQSLVPF